MPSCHICAQYFDDYELLAHHIIKNKKTHKRSRSWATKYLATKSLSAKARNGELKGRTPLTEEQKEAKRNTIRVLSGEMKYIQTICPKCKTQQERKLETEFIKSPYAWRINGMIVRLCEDCAP
jgi:ribosomal protein L32